MILQALARYYQILAADPESGIALSGYSTVGVSFAVVLSPEGELKAILPLFQSETRGKKVVELPLRRIVPEQVKRSGTSPSPNFLWDNAAYVLGISNRDAEDPDYAARRFEAFRELNLKILSQANCPEARAVVAFLSSFDQQHARQHALVAEKLEELQGGNLMFMLEGATGFVHDAPEIRQAWETYKAAASSDVIGQCLVSGEITAIARLHPNLKGIRDANPTGATLVGFNARAYESYNRTNGQGLNSPTGEKAVFEYTTALNYLLSSESSTPKFSIGDATVVCWAESSNRVYEEVFSALFDPGWVDLTASTSRRDPAAGQRLKEIAQKVKSGAPMDKDRLMEGLDPGTRFYVLGLAPNAARVAVRFFHRDPFAKVVARIMAHYEDMAIEREFEFQPARISIREILEETVSKKARNKEVSPLLAGALMRAILTDTPYPAALFYAIMNRIRADADEPERRIRKINYARAAVIKAFLARKYRNQPQAQIQEVLCMSLNEQSTHPAYLLGRLFAVLEKAQTDALGNINASIKDRYFTAACASPSTVFPVLLRLAQHHIAKAEYGYANDRRIEAILGLIRMEQNPIPSHLSLDDQGIFVLGYYHQRAAFFAPKNSVATSETNSTTIEQ
jgi:CRISPR-associated protein Csd1